MLAAVELAAEPTGRLDIAVSVPGGGGMAAVLDYEPEQVADIVSFNVVAPFTMIKHAGRLMADAGGGSIVAVSSTAAIQSCRFLAAYCAGKAGVDALVRVDADELGSLGVRVNAVRLSISTTWWPPARPPSGVAQRQALLRGVTTGRLALTIAVIAVSLAACSVEEPDPSGERFTTVAAGGDHSCGIRDDGTAQCWRGNENNPGWAVYLSGNFTAISAGSGYSCGIRDNGAAECWEDNYQAGVDPPEGRFTAVSVGDSQSCGIRSNGTLQCWGNVAGGPDPPPPPEGTFTAISVGWGTASCGLRDDGTAVCWGGAGWETPPEGSFSAITVGSSHACGLGNDGIAVCWGDNTDEQANPPLSVYTAIAAGASFTCGIRDDQTVRCWGRGGVVDPPGDRFIALSAGLNRACGLRDDNKVRCWD